MNIKLGDIVSEENQNALVVLQSIKFPIKVSYRIKRIADKLIPEIQAFKEKKLELFKEFGTFDKDPETGKELQSQTILPENIAKYQEQIVLLADTEIVVDIEKINIDELTQEIEPKYLLAYIFE